MKSAWFLLLVCVCNHNIFIDIINVADCFLVTKGYGSHYLFHNHHCQGILDDSIDISSDFKGGILKKILVAGNANKGYPLQKDIVEITWKIYDSTGGITHDSLVALGKPFDFTIGAEPRHVILGWETAVKSMYEGEISSYVIKPEYAFGEKGVPPLNITPNMTIRCDLELLRIRPSIIRSYPTVGANESIKDELLEKIQSGDSVISSEVMENKKINATKTSEQRRFFDGANDKLDPNQRIFGEGKNHVWEETARNIDVEVPLPLSNKEYTKYDLTVEIKMDELIVSLVDSGEILFSGPLHGKVKPSESVWTLLPRDPTARLSRSPRVAISLEKAYGFRDIWATVLRRSYLGEGEIPEEEDPTA